MRIPVREHPPIRSQDRLAWLSFETSKHPLFRSRAQNAMMRKMYPPEEINTGSERSDKKLIGMKTKLQFDAKKMFELWHQLLNRLFGVRDNDKIIRIADVILRAQLSLHILIKLVHVDIDEKL